MEINISDMQPVTCGAYTVQEIADKLGMPIRTAYDFCKNTDDFIVKQLGSRTLRINKSSFDAWWNNRN